MIQHLTRDCLAVICSFLLGCYSYYDHSTLGTITSSDDEKTSGDSSFENNSSSAVSSLTHLKDVIPILSLMHTHPSLHENIYHNEMIWSHLTIPIPDFLQSKSILNCLTAELEDGDVKIISDRDEKIFKLMHQSLETLCDTSLIKKVVLTTILDAKLRNRDDELMDFTGYVIRAFPNVEELKLTTKFNPEQTLFKYPTTHNKSNIPFWKNLKKISVSDYDSLNFFLNHPQLEHLESVSLYDARKKKETIQLVTCNSKIKNIEILSLISIADVENLVSVSQRVNVLKISERSSTFNFSSFLKDTLTKFDNLRILSMSFPSFSSYGSNSHSIELSVDFPSLEEASFRFLNESNASTLIFKQVTARKLKFLTFSNCCLETNSDTSQVKLPRVTNLQFCNVVCNKCDFWTSLPFLSTFFASYISTYYGVTPSSNKYEFRNQNYLRNITISGACESVIIDNSCRELKKISLSHTNNVDIQLEDISLSYLKMEHISGIFNVQVKECEKLILRNMVESKDCSLNIDRVQNLEESFEQSDRIAHHKGILNVNLVKVGLQENRTSDERLKSYLLSFGKVDNIQIITSTMNGAVTKAISKIYSVSSREYLLDTLIPMLVQPISYLDRVTHVENIAPTYGLESLTITQNNQCKIHAIPSLKQLHVLSSRIWTSKNYDILVDFDTFPDLHSLSLAKHDMFSPKQVFANLKRLRLTEITQITLRLNLFPNLKELIVFGKPSKMKVELGTDTLELPNLVIFNIYGIDTLEFTSLHSMKAPKLRELVIQNINDLNLGCNALSPQYQEENWPVLLHCTIQENKEIATIKDEKNKKQQHNKCTIA
ncbi:hypothetical protein FDP41_010445 [Naegleria fowleri]|uniref:Uncharacterized protein n=1 Tax=Naegleria fowleri TaxID=5763 RepID=A0A6A5CCQ2_NAEFO|nr:uncharacterized protein FDP41_010445 [Naegleria fowleri]KAF0983380.1 hypothetical protein FDP41_010445 [Naegleria fowleri]